MRARRLLAGAVCVAVTATALLGVPAANAAAPDRATAPSTALLRGSLHVVPFEAPAVVRVLGEPEPDLAAPGEPTVTLRTDDGQTVEITGAAVADAVTGARFEGEVAIAGEVARTVTTRIAAKAVAPDDAELAEIVAGAASDAESPLRVVTATVTPPVASAVTPRQHKVEIAWLGPSGAPSATDADINAALARLSEYWVSQSNGQITGIVRQGAIKRQIIPAAECGAFQTYKAINRGAALFGRDMFSYTNALHLLVLVPAVPACDGAGIEGQASLGSGVHAGGTIWQRADPASYLDWTQTLAHEFGHNLSLNHSGVRQCTTPPQVDVAPTSTGAPGSACSDDEYADAYDVMGGGYSVVDFDGDLLITNERDIGALNVTQKARIDALPRGSALLPVTIAGGDSQTFTIAPASGTTGVRGLEIVDPKNGGKLYVEYRSGTGRDAQTIYAKWASVMGDDEFGPGVRVFRYVTCTVECTLYGSTAYSAAFERHRAGSPAVSLWHGGGTQTASYSGGATVKVVSTSASGAVVQVLLDDGLLKFSTKPTATIATAPAFYGKTLTVNGADAAAWEPDATSVTYQWLRAGVPIAGATAKTYQVNGADIGAQLTARVTAAKSGYTTTSATSAAVTPGGPTTSRISGASRYETAVAVSVAAFSGTVPVVYIATGANYPDALAAAPAAATKGGPLLLVPSSGAVPAAVLARLTALNPARIVVVGGTGAVPASSVAQLSAAVPGATVNRLFGASRYETGRALVRDAFGATGAAEVFIATGRNYPDALSASAVAGGRGEPVILVDGTLPKLDAASLTLISDLGPEQVKIAGGTGAVSAGIQSQLAGLGYSVERLSGASRYETSVEINAKSFASASVPTHYWATGTGFADALSGAVLAAVKGAPMYVVQPTCVPVGVATQIGAKTTGAVVLIGGAGALNANVAALGRC